ncbi:MAG: AI-2E family transporter [Gemmatimonadaceae bacterium]
MSDHPSAVVPEVARRAAESPEESPLAPDVDPAVPAEPAEPGAPPPNLAATRRVLAHPASQSLGVTMLAVLALLYTLYFARAFLVPIVFAILLNFLLSPVIRMLARFRVRPPLGAALVVAALLAALGGGAYALSGPAQRWAAAAPAALARSEEKLRRVVRPVQQVSRTAEQVERAAGRMGVAVSPPPQQQVVVHSGQSLASRLFGTTERLLAALLEVVILLYFLLAGGDLFLQKLIKVLPHFSDKVKAVEIARATESAVSAYLSTALLVNAAEGAVVTGVLWLVGLPNAPLWGVLVAFLELIPYVGAATIVFVLAIAGLTTFDNVGQALLAPASFLVVNLLQANVVSPLLLGHRLTLNPVAIFIGLAFFFWIWGVPGGFLAVPLLATFKILCDHIAPLAAIGEFLGQRDEAERRVVVRS